MKKYSNFPVKGIVRTIQKALCNNCSLVNCGSKTRMGMIMRIGRRVRVSNKFGKSKIKENIK
jgi:hypothetical protein